MVWRHVIHEYISVTAYLNWPDKVWFGFGFLILKILLLSMNWIALETINFLYKLNNSMAKLIKEHDDFPYYLKYQT